uniref:USP domain-containing protein n=1 Tax=Panagrolaimus sp. PS1159 TaxID=55785 RepID=A0AC35FWB4_9BILA
MKIYQCLTVYQNCNSKCSKIFPSKFISLPQIFVLAISPLNTAKRRIVKTTVKNVIEKDLDISKFIVTDDDTFSCTSADTKEEEQTSLKSLKRRRCQQDDDEYFAEIEEEKPIKKQLFIFPDMIDARATTSTPDSDGGDSGLGNENCSPPLEPQLPDQMSTTYHLSNNKQIIIKNAKYKLEGIIYHRGDAKGGHYYAKIKNHMSSSSSSENTNDEWIECNDTKVSVTSIDSQCDDQPYLFFYCLNNSNCNV